MDQKRVVKKVIAGALGECVHVAGVSNFLRLADAAGWDTVFLGPAVSVEKMLEAARREEADLVGVSYRLTPENGERLLAEFAEAADDLRANGIRFVFGGTPPVAGRARSLGFFDLCFDGTESPDQVLAYLKGGRPDEHDETNFPQTTIERIRWKTPFPLIRHHFGQPTIAATIKGIEQIAAASVLDVISLGVDQDAQANFFHPERQNPRRRGAGGVPVRAPGDFRALYAASRRGNFPLLRTYTGCDDFIRLAEMYVANINIAWAAIPLLWFNRMDGRGPWNLQGSIHEHQKLMTWYGRRNIPVEINEPHHWGMRDAPDVIFVVAAYLSAYNARAFGIRDYFTSLMFNSPPGLSDAMDLAKMLACLEMITPLEGEGFRIWRQTRTGLLSYPVDPDAARAHLAASAYLQMTLRPHILHVVGYTEAHHAATADDVIESCKLARRAIDNALRGQPDMTADPQVQARQEELVREAQVTLEAIQTLADPGVPDPLTDPVTLARSVTMGILDAPQLRNNPFARGKIITRINRGGACVAVDPQTKRDLSEQERIAALEIEE